MKVGIIDVHGQQELLDCRNAAGSEKDLDAFVEKRLHFVVGGQDRQPDDVTL